MACDNLADILTPFRSSRNSIEFLENGFTSLNFLTDDDVEKVSCLYRDLNKDGRLNEPQFFGVNYSVAALEASKSMELTNSILSIIQQRLDAHFTDFEIFGTLFINKPANTKETFTYHQDWSYTDENKFAIATCWVPLIDVDEKNGGISFIKGSHRFFNTYRSVNFDSLRLPFEQIPNGMKQNIALKKGDGICFHPAVFHGSFPNQSDQQRPVLVFAIKPKIAPIYHYLKRGEVIDVLEIPPIQFNQFITGIPKGELPAGVELKTSISNNNYNPTLIDILTKYRSTENKYGIFRDSDKEKAYTENGFMHLTNVLPENSISCLIELYEKNFDTQKGMHVSHHNCNSVDTNKFISNSIFEILTPFISRYFSDYKTMIAHFAVKSLQYESAFNLHQDWSIVDEKRFDVAHLWIPLCDVTSQNGTLELIPSSHLLFQNWRSGSCGIRFTDIKQYPGVLHNFTARKGDIIVYHPAVFHGSGPNLTNRHRIAIVASICHQEARLTYFHKEDNNINAYELLEVDLFSRLSELAEGGKPSGRKIGAAVNDMLTISDEELVDRLRKINV